MFMHQKESPRHSLDNLVVEIDMKMRTTGMGQSGVEKEYFCKFCNTWDAQLHKDKNKCKYVARMRKKYQDG